MQNCGSCFAAEQFVGISCGAKGHAFHACMKGHGLLTLAFFFILSLYYTTRRRDCHSKPEYSPASPSSSFWIVKHPASCSAHLPRWNTYSIRFCIQLFRRKVNPTPVAKIPAEKSSTSSHSPSGVPSPVFGGVA